jgi:hypothetical protein
VNAVGVLSSSPTVWEVDAFCAMLARSVREVGGLDETNRDPEAAIVRCNQQSTGFLAIVERVFAVDIATQRERRDEILQAVKHRLPLPHPSSDITR